MEAYKIIKISNDQVSLCSTSCIVLIILNKPASLTRVAMCYLYDHCLSTSCQHKAEVTDDADGSTLKM